MKIKKFLSFTAAAVMTVMALTSSMSVSAAGTELSGSCGTNAKWFINTDDVLVISGTGSTTRDEYLQWKDYCQDVKNVLVEEGITELSSDDFAYCKNASEIIFPSTVVSLGGCMSSSNLENLKDIWIFSKNVENSKLDGWNALYPRPGSGVKWHIYADSTTETSLRDGLKLTDDDFEYITESEKIPEVTNRTPAVLPESTETSGPCGLHSTWSWNEDTKTLTFKGSGSIAISKDFRKFADKIEKVEMKDSEITSICDGAFSKYDGCDPSTESVYPKIKSVTFPSTLKYIGHCAFLNTALANENLELPEGLEKIQDNAFRNTNISGTLKLPASLKSIGQGAFYNTKLEYIEFNNSEKLIIRGGVFCLTNLKKITLSNNIDYGVYYTNPPGPNALFRDCSLLETAVVPGDGVSYDRFSDPTENALPEQFFYGCKSLKTVYIQEGLKVIQSQALDNCVSLEDIYIFSTDLTTLNAANSPYQAIDMSNNPTFHVLKYSTTENTLRDAGYITDENVVYLADTKSLKEAVSNAEEVDETKYTAETISVLASALDNAKAVLENPDATQEEVDNAVTVIEDAIKGLVEKPTQPSPPKSEPTKPEPSNSITKTPSKAARSKEAVKKDRSAAKKAMKQAKISKLKVKSKAKKKINVSWKKVKKAKGYQVQVSAKKNFKKVIFKKDLKKTKLTIKNKKIKSKKTYFVRVRAYATYKDANNKTVKVYSKWNKQLRKVKVK